MHEDELKPCSLCGRTSEDVKAGKSGCPACYGELVERKDDERSAKKWASICYAKEGVELIERIISWQEKAEKDLSDMQG